MATVRPSRDEVRRHRERLQELGLRPVQIWVPDTRSPAFAEDSPPSIGSGRRERARHGRSGVRGCHFGRMAVKRGEVWTVSGGVYASKPRPGVILQFDQFSETPSMTLAPCTTDPTEAPLFRLNLTPDDENGLRSACRLMVDKITTVSKANLGQRIGRLKDDDLTRLARAAVVFLGLA